MHYNARKQITNNGPLFPSPACGGGLGWGKSGRDRMPTEPAAPHIELPRRYNAAVDLIERNLKAGRADKVAFRDDDGAMTYGDLAERADRAANMLRGLGVEPEQRIVLCMLDSNDLPAMFLGAIKAGSVPVPINT